MRKKILIVDDEKDIVSVLAKRLETKGYKAISASNGKEALNIIKQNAVDLIILDIMMPVMDGTALAESLRDDPGTSGIPVIFLTALQTRQEQRASAGLVGSRVIFAKPFNFEELVGKIKELTGEQSMSD
jgi:DNA-binding response OmpR family regulator